MLQRADTESPDYVALDEMPGRDVELYWRDRYAFFEKRGYQLWRRSWPGWVPLSKAVKRARTPGGELPPYARENIMHATRILDGAQVCIKRVVSGSDELRIACMFSSTPLCDDPANHAVPILDTFEDEENEYISYLVMPLLRHIDDPPMTAVGDVVEFIDQILEGLVFLHERSVAHRDCSYANLMADASARNPPAYHPESYLSPGVGQVASDRPSTEGSVKHFFIDFGLSVHVQNGSHHTRVIGNEGRDRDPPELSRGDKIPYDPFKLDVFLIGNVFRKTFLNRYSNVRFLRPLAASMTQDDPYNRPTATGALELWRHIRSRKVGSWKRRLRTCGGAGASGRNKVFSIFLFVCLGLLCLRLVTDEPDGAVESQVSFRCCIEVQQSRRV
ncbi:hypothetical protein DAEQUDRAFT_701868 [Daedalea quercina L-15889]|uniref:Protein kinase domain-containing protein n=1 Tax=Daedalea quercina L-15889 TaxID=1314783 RepID=A0A165U6Y2_9APHY|nr:hypothetical protein DAEQUDRAFT_701868 [Daedalea quercina L-15889]